MLLRATLLLSTCLFLLGCGTDNQKSIHGLWELKTLTIDGYERQFEPIFLEMNADSSFAVSKVAGDLIGIYELKIATLDLHSTDPSWFNTSWDVDFFPTSLLLTGLELGHRNTQLKFSKIEEVPDFESFEESIVGDWEFYKIRRKRKLETLTNTRFVIDEEGNFQILENKQLLEQGRASIDTRHRKMIFEKDQTKWRAWFYGRELRLSNDKLDIHYSLRAKKAISSTAAL